MAEPQAPLEGIVQRMIDAGESEENIGAVIQHYKSQPTGDRYTGPDTYAGGVVESLKKTASDTGAGIVQGVKSFFDPRTYAAGYQQKKADEQQWVDEAAGRREPSHDYGMANVRALGHTLSTPEGGGETIGNLLTGLVLPRVATGVKSAYGGRVPKGVLMTTAERTGAAPVAIEPSARGYGFTPADEAPSSALSDVALAQREADAGRLAQSVVDAMKRGKSSGPGVLETRGNLALKPQLDLSPITPPQPNPKPQAAIDAAGRTVGFESGEGANYHAGDLAVRERRLSNQGPPNGTTERRLLPADDVRQAYRANPELGKQADAMRARFADLRAEGRASIDAGGSDEGAIGSPPPTSGAAKPRLDAVQTARYLRDQYGAEQGGRMLYGKQPPGGGRDIPPATQRTAMLKELAAKSTLPDSARASIDNVLASASPEEAQAYFAKGNPLAQKYMQFKWRDKIGDEAGFGVTGLMANPRRVLPALFGEALARHFGAPPMAGGALGYATPEIAGGAKAFLQSQEGQAAIRAAMLAQMANRDESGVLASSR